MKNLNVMMTVKATSANNAEEISMNALMNMAKILAKKGYSSMAGGSGNANHLSEDMYHVDSKIFLDGSIAKEDIKAIQSAWMDNAEIINSMILVEEDDEPVKAKEIPVTHYCEQCGKEIDNGEFTVYGCGFSDTVCAECLNYMINRGDVFMCNECDEYIYADEQHENPVTGELNICPHCGYTN